MVYRSAHQMQPDLSTYELRALVCYYGSHYACFVRTDEPDAHALCASRHGGAGAARSVLALFVLICGLATRCSPQWTRIDDASVTVVGSWEALCAACARGHLQPTVLFYERPP